MFSSVGLFQYVSATQAWFEPLWKLYEVSLKIESLGFRDRRLLLFIRCMCARIQLDIGNAALFDEVGGDNQDGWCCWCKRRSDMFCVCRYNVRSSNTSGFLCSPSRLLTNAVHGLITGNVNFCRTCKSLVLPGYFYSSWCSKQIQKASSK